MTEESIKKYFKQYMKDFAVIYSDRYLNFYLVLVQLISITTKYEGD